MSTPTQIYSGSCLCGAVAYTIEGAIEAAGACHCRDCRKVTGGPFGVSFAVTKDRFRLRGETASFSKAADSGAMLVRHFCAACGSPLFTASEVHPDRIYVKAGSLDQPEAVRIDRQAWMASAVAWSVVPPLAAAYQKGRT